MALFTGVFLLVWIGIAVLMIAGWWKIFTKAGKPGWAAIIPIYNIIILTEIVGRPTWWVFIYYAGCTTIIGHIILSLDLARSFGKDVGYGVGLILLPWLFYPMLGFSSAQYVGPSAKDKN
ncbi:MAG: signal peptidase I [Bacteroidetes bacterium]|nr:signal peptidase I [Bacteroidota bacterium]